MTTIAVKLGSRGEPSSIASDRQYTYNGITAIKGRPKLEVLEGDVSMKLFESPRAILGFAGSASELAKLRYWLLDIAQPPPELKDLELLCLCKHGIFHTMDLSIWLPVERKTFAIGSGGEFALAAMEAGKSPLEAVKIAAKLDIKTGMGFKEEYL